jgi:hypothetical protein
MIQAKIKIKPVDVTAIKRRDIGRRKRRKTGVIRIPMIVETSKARPRPPIRVEENLVIRGSAVGFISSFSLRMVLR